MAIQIIIGDMMNIDLETIIDIETIEGIGIVEVGQGVEVVID